MPKTVRALADDASVLVAPGDCKANAGDLFGIQNGGEPVGKDVQIEIGRRDEVDLRAVVFGHGWLRVFRFRCRLAQICRLGYGAT